MNACVLAACLYSGMRKCYVEEGIRPEEDSVVLMKHCACWRQTVHLATNLEQLPNTTLVGDYMEHVATW